MKYFFFLLLFLPSPKQQLLTQWTHISDTQKPYAPNRRDEANILYSF